MVGRSLTLRPVALSDNELLDFDASGLAMAQAGDARRLLHQHGDVFRAQLVAARWLDAYRQRRLSETEQLVGGWHHEHEEGWDEAVRDVIAHLRQGDFLPGGKLYEDEQVRD